MALRRKSFSFGTGHEFWPWHYYLLTMTQMVKESYRAVKLAPSHCTLRRRSPRGDGHTLGFDSYCRIRQKTLRFSNLGYPPALFLSTS